MTAVNACSCSKTFTVLEYEPGAESKLPNLPLAQSLEPGMVLNVIVSTTSATYIDILDIHTNLVIHIAPKVTSLHLNSLIGGGFGAHEETSKIPIRIDAGVKYSMHIVHELTGFRLFVNGEDAYLFKHRIHNPGVSFRIRQPGQCFYFSHKLNEPKWAVQQSNNTMYIREFSDAGKESPHEIQLQGSRPLSSIVITGIINNNADSVVFNLLNYCDEEMFSFDIRLQENYVVRNSFIEGVWGKEERYGAMVFQKNKRFTLAIDVEDYFYKIYVDGVEFITYNHRAPPTNVTKIKISAGIKIFKTVYQK